ncbi:MAG: hypothetical protein K1X55_16080 [Chitinophagales bacterium]|nr:hypothetical protein [Chitinophagales bacterium]
MNLINLIWYGFDWEGPGRGSGGGWSTHTGWASTTYMLSSNNPQQAGLYGYSGGETVPGDYLGSVTILQPYSYNTFTMPDYSGAGNVVTPTGDMAAMGGGNSQYDDYGAKTNITTQEQVKLFTNEKDAYNYLWDNTFSNDNGLHCNNSVKENFALVVDKGVLVYPTFGKNTDGNDFVNNPSSSNPYVLSLKKENNSLYVFYNNQWLKVKASIHTHPNIDETSVESHSGSDMAFTNYTNVPSFIISPNTIYGMVPNNAYSYPLFDRNYLLEGNISLIHQLDYIISFMK